MTGIKSEKVKRMKKTYEINGKKYPRMAKVLEVIPKPEFYRWYGKHGYDKCKSIIEDRAAFGTRCHSEFEHLLNGEDVWCDNDEMTETMNMFAKWIEAHNVSPIHTEYMIFDDDISLAGTADFIGFVNGKKVLGDWKTSKNVYDSHKIQVAGYLYMYEKCENTKLDGAFVAAFRDGKKHIKHLSRDECMELLPVLKACRTIYGWKYLNEIKEF